MNLYEILGVKPGSTAKQIKKAYYTKSKIHHPDKGGDPEMFKQLVVAYGILSDPEKRKRYDSGESADDISKATISFDQEVIQSMCGMFVQVVANGDVKKRDLVATMKGMLGNAITGLTQNIIAHKSVVEKFEAAIKRIKTKDETNPFVTAAQSQISACNVTISKIQHQIDIGNGGLKFLEAFSYDFDPAVTDALKPTKRKGSSMNVFFQGIGGSDE